MLSLGPLAFSAPWVLLALSALPAVWWLARLTPPAPRLVRFPAIRLLYGLRQEEETPDRTPPWLVLLRVVLAALVVLGLAGPLLNPAAPLHGSGPLLLVIDDGWAAAGGWSRRVEAADGLIEQGGRDERPIYLLTTAPAAGPSATASALRGPFDPARARAAVEAMAPRPWPVDRPAAAAALDGTGFAGSATVVWLSDGLAREGDGDFARSLQRLGRLAVLQDGALRLPMAMRPPSSEGGALVVRAERATAEVATSRDALARAEDGRVLARAGLRFAAGERTAEARLSLPGELRNEIVRLELAETGDAGGTFLLDERWRRRPVGIVRTDAGEGGLPLLGEIYYLERALRPFAETTVGSLDELLERPLAVLALPDAGDLPDVQGRRLAAWIEDGGTLVRFAGPRLAQDADALVPVALRRGGRAFGGALSWRQPARLGPFPAEGPFAGLSPPPDVSVTRQVLAQPVPELERQTWARLADGTPLVTAARMDAGRLVLFHVTATPDWSNLPMSGLFVEMLRRIVSASAGIGGAAESGLLRPLAVLDGFGRLGTPPPEGAAIAAQDWADVRPGPRSPPGFYGDDSGRQALNLGDSLPPLEPMAGQPPGVSVSIYGARAEVPLAPWLLGGAIALLVLDLLASLAMRGLLPWRRVAAGLLVAVAAGALGPPTPAGAQSREQQALEATLTTRLAFVETGNPEVDRASRAGLSGLGRVVMERTSVELGEPMAVDPAAHELAFHPLIYWPVTEGQATLSPQGAQRVAEYLRDGGMILFDTRDRQLTGLGAQADGATGLRRVLGPLRLPALNPVPAEHVLTKSFYLLQEFPGRWAGGTLWLAAAGSAEDEDAISSVLVGGNDWAAAWALDETGRPLFPVVPGAEAQREYAYRFGINLVMYALTGNYKADQVHVPAILERLGQ